MDIREAERRGLLERFDPTTDYLNHVAQFVDLEAIRNAGLNIVVDSMYGAGAGYFDTLISGGAPGSWSYTAKSTPLSPA